MRNLHELVLAEAKWLLIIVDKFFFCFKLFFHNILKTMSDINKNNLFNKMWITL